MKRLDAYFLGDSSDLEKFFETIKEAGAFDYLVKTSEIYSLVPGTSLLGKVIKDKDTNYLILYGQKGRGLETQEQELQRLKSLAEKFKSS